VGTITPALCGVHNDDITPLAHNVEEAKALLGKAGWRDTNGDGVLDKGGQKFSFTLMTNTGNKRRADISVLFQDQMKQLGIEVNLERIEGNTMGDRLRKRDYQAYLYGWSAALFVDPSDAWSCETDATPRTFNFTNYCNADVDKLIAQGLQTPDPRDAAPIWREVQAKIYEDQPYLFLWWMDELVAVHERFDNYNINVLSNLHNLHEWSVPPEKVKYKR
jgi:peptide/nickel transport system substrate-binding protein